MKRSPRLGETICANATTLPSPIAVIRISGSQASSALVRLFKLTAPPVPRYVIPGRLDLKTCQDEAVCWYQTQPNTATGEDYAEVMVHGSKEIVRQTLEQLHSLGVRLAEPGEFSYRAYLNNKVTLMEAMALPSLLGSQTSQDLQQVKSFKYAGMDQWLQQIKSTLLALYNTLQI